jgi:hypothetical protein
VQPAKARATVYALDRGGIRNDRGQAERAVLVKGVYKGRAEVIVDDAETRADGRLAPGTEDFAEEPAREVRRISSGNTRTEVFIVVRPIRSFAAGLSGKAKAECRTGHLALRLQPRPSIDEVTQAKVWRHLIPICLIRRFQDRVT